MKAEIFFLKYAFPCSFILLSRKEVNEKEYELLYKSAKEEKLYLPIDRIEKIFWRAVRFIGSIKNLQRVKKYWRFEHNKILKSGNFEILDKKLLKECMVIPCEVLSVNKESAITESKFFDGYIKLKTDFVKVKPGDRVTKHYGYACEKISESLYKRMIENLKEVEY